MRINKFLSTLGIASRRTIDKYIEEGRITVNGNTATTGMDINENDNILIVTSDISPCDIDKYNSLYKRNYEKVVAYNTKKLKINKEEVLETLKDVDIITFLSSSTVEAFYKSLDGDFFILGDKKIASIGPMTSETIKRLGMKVDYEAEKYTADGLLDVIFK